MDDAGVPRPDAGTRDAGFGDAGWPPDAGTPEDAGVADAGFGMDASDSSVQADSVVLRFDFDQGHEQWQAGFTDYSPAMEDGMDLVSRFVTEAESPPNVDAAFLLAGTNTSDDLFMFARRQIGTEEGLTDGISYMLNYTVTFWSDARSGCAGIGGAPGESVYFKVGGSTDVPGINLNDDRYELDADKGNQATGGTAASVAGNVANGQPCEDGEEGFFPVTLEHTHPVPVEATLSGSLWLLLGTDSGFEGRTEIYLDTVEVELVPSEHQFD